MVGAVDVRGLVHMTGGGFPENIPRVVPKGLAARVRRDAWEVPALFQWLQKVRQRGRDSRCLPVPACLLERCCADATQQFCAARPALPKQPDP